MYISEEIIARWQLSDLAVICESANKAVYSGESALFGPVILKTDTDSVKLCREYEILSRLAGKGCCRVFGLEAGMLLEARILPGTRLRQESSMERRIETLQAVFGCIHIPVSEGRTYLNWLEDACRYCHGHAVPELLRGKGEKARAICAEMFGKYPERMLLHGDLHHDNLLLRSDGSYAVIDPKGIVGPEVLDLPRFILNEGTDGGHIREVIRRISQRFGYPLADIQKVYFMEVILANIWCLEDGQPISEPAIHLADAILEEAL